MNRQSQHNNGLIPIILGKCADNNKSEPLANFIQTHFRKTQLTILNLENRYQLQSN